MKDLVPLKVTGRIDILKIIPYKGVPILIRRIDGDIFQYDLMFDGQFFSDYLIMKPAKGKKKMTKKEIAKSAGVILAGACATVDILFDGKETMGVKNNG